MGSDTRKALIESAASLFSARWYGIVSVAEICRSANLSNGAFYRHFKNKEEIFCAILDYVVGQIESALAPLAQIEPNDRLRQFVRIIYDFSQNNTPLVRVFREGQYRLFEYERKLKGRIRKSFLP